MSRRPESQPILDQLAAVSFTDPEPASIRHLQRADLRTHALMSAWGGAGTWVPLRHGSSKVWMGGLNPQVCMRAPPGVEYVRVDMLVSGSGTLVLTSATTGITSTLIWEDEGGGNTLDAARFVSTSGAAGDANGPLQLRSGYLWTWADDEVTLDYQAGTGTVWGLRVTPVHVPR